MNFSKPFFVSIGILSTLTGCASQTSNALVKTSDGQILSGTTTASLSGGTFRVQNTDGSLVCSGSYDVLTRNPTISAPVECNDGRFGVAKVTRTPDWKGGAGTVKLSDGSSANVGFGSKVTSVLQPAPNHILQPVPNRALNNTATKHAKQSRPCLVGPRGGTYVLTASGRKDYSACESSPKAASIFSTRRCYTGPRGGRYTITASGRKNYNGC